MAAHTARAVTIRMRFLLPTYVGPKLLSRVEGEGGLREAELQLRAGCREKQFAEDRRERQKYRRSVSHPGEELTSETGSTPCAQHPQVTQVGGHALSSSAGDAATVHGSLTRRLAAPDALNRSKPATIVAGEPPHATDSSTARQS